MPHMHCPQLLKDKYRSDEGYLQDQGMGRPLPHIVDGGNSHHCEGSGGQLSTYIGHCAGGDMKTKPPDVHNVFRCESAFFCEPPCIHKS